MQTAATCTRRPIPSPELVHEGALGCDSIYFFLQIKIFNCQGRKRGRGRERGEYRAKQDDGVRGDPTPYTLHP